MDTYKSSFKGRRTVRQDRQPKGIDKMAQKIYIYNIKTISTDFGHNTAEVYYKHILLTMVCIF